MSHKYNLVYVYAEESENSGRNLLGCKEFF